MPAYRMLIEYDGGGFHGWQIQEGHRTVQEDIEKALQILLHERPNVVGSGRTDAGVHARGQVAHFHTVMPLDPVRIRQKLNGLLRPNVAVHVLKPSDEQFHARYDARLRRYHYYVSTAPVVLDRSWRVGLYPVPDFDRMNEAARLFLGRKDYDAFCRTKSDTTNRVCDVSVAEWVPERRPDCWYFRVEADRFLHGMVRSMVGTLIDVGRGRRSEEELQGILNSRDRRCAGAAAPAHGLVLEEVTYEYDLW